LKMNFGYLLVLFLCGHVALDVQAMPNNIFGVRSKRSEKRQTLNDQNDCVRQCLTDHTNRVSEIKANSKMNIALKANQEHLAENSPELKAAAVQNVQDMMNDLCKAGEDSQACLKACPKSNFQALSLIQLSREKDEACFPVKQVNNFEQFYETESCTKRVLDQKKCENDCQQPLAVHEATNFKFDSRSNPAVVSYETDKQKNAADAQRACENQKCHMDCNKPLLSSQCNQQAYTWYVRAKKSEAKATLASLRHLGALAANEPAACADFR